MKKYLPFLVSLFFLVSAMQAQDVFFYGANGKPLQSEQGAHLKREIRKRSEKRSVITTSELGDKGWKKVLREKVKIQDGRKEMIIKRKGDALIASTIYRSYTELEPGLYNYEDRSTKRLLRKGSSSRLLPLHKEGMEILYGDKEQILSKSEYRDNQLITNENWLPDGSKYIDSVFYSVDKEPEFKLGDQHFNQYILASLNNSGFDLTRVDDQVIIGWVVMEDGSLDGIYAVEGKSLQLNRLMIEIIASLPADWAPATLDGKVVRYFMTIPFNFINRSASFQDLDLSSGMLHYNKY